MENPHSAPAREAAAGVGVPGAPGSAGALTARGRSPTSGVGRVAKGATTAGQPQEGMAFDLPFCSCVLGTGLTLGFLFVGAGWERDIRK